MEPGHWLIYTILFVLALVACGACALNAVLLHNQRRAIRHLDAVHRDLLQVLRERQGRGRP